MVHVPKIAHGRVAITNVAGARRREYALGRAGLRADNQVIAVEPKLLQRQREERKQLRVVAGRTGEPLQERGGDFMRSERVRERIPIQHERENVRAGQHLCQGFQYPFPASTAHQPVMYQSNSQFTQVLHALLPPLLGSPARRRSWSYFAWGCLHAAPSLFENPATPPQRFSPPQSELGRRIEVSDRRLRNIDPLWSPERHLTRRIVRLRPSKPADGGSECGLPA